MKLHLTSNKFSGIIRSRIVGTEEEHIIQTVSYDTRKILDAESTAFFALEGEFRDGHQYLEEAYNLGIRVFVVSKKINVSAFKNAQFHEVSSTLGALQSLAEAHRNKFNIPVIAITGSVGKTVVKEWLFHLICEHFSIVRSPKSYNSQLGVALSLLEINESHTIGIFEAGISQAHEMSLLAKMISPNIGVFTSFGTAHAHNFSSREEHLSEKKRLFNSCEKVFYLQEIPMGNDTKYTPVDQATFEPLLAVSPFQDKASRDNLSLAIAVAKELKLPEKEIISKIKTLPRLALRMETFDGINGNLIINDAYNADLDALTQSLEYQMSLSKDKLRTAIIGVDGLDEQQLRKIKHKIKSFNLYQCFFVSGKEIPPIDQIHQQVVLIKGTRISNIQRIATLFQLKKHKTRIEVNLSAVKQNLHFFRNSIPPTCKVLVMVKASSYGSGAEKMAEFLEKNGVHYLGVAYTDEGIELRKYGIKLPILVMNAEEDSFDEIIRHQLEPSIYSFEVLEEFTKALINVGLENYPIHLKFDTGMRRLGFESQDVDKVIQLIQTQPEIKIQSVYSHLAETDNFNNSTFTKQQIDQFEKICRKLERELPYNLIKHILNSEGIIRFPEAQFDMVRIGIGLYGISSNPALKKNLAPVISWKSSISQVKTLKPGESVGYNRTFIAQKETRIAIIPVGYADGYRRALSQGKGNILVHGKPCPTVGNVCMDMTMIDVSEIICKTGDEVEIIGPHQNIHELAASSQTIPYEVLTSLSKRLQRIYLEEQ